MKGSVLAYSPCARAGVIRCEKGKTYYFSIADWQNHDPPSTGTVVDFMPAVATAKQIGLPGLSGPKAKL